MPFIPSELQQENEAARGPHLGLVTEEGVVAIPQGAHLWLVEDAKNPSKIYPMVLLKVSHQKLVFGITDADGGFSEYEYRLTRGRPMNKPAVERMLKTGKPVQRHR